MTNKFEVFRPSSDTAEALYAAANHELKAFDYLALLAMGESTPTEVANNVIRITGIEDCRGSLVGYPPIFEAHNFAVERRGKNHRGHQASFFTAIRMDVAAPVIVTNLDWMLQREKSLIPILSTATSRSEHSRAPVNTINILDALLAGLKLTADVLPGYRLNVRGTPNYMGRVKALADNGIVNIDDPNRFEIDNPTYRGTKKFENLTAVNAAVYKVLKTAKDMEAQRHSTWSIDEIVDLALRSGYIDESDTTKFRVLMGKVVFTGSPRVAPGAVKKIEERQRGISIVDSERDSVEDLVKRVKTIDRATDAAKRKQAGRVGEFYHNDNLAVEMVMRKIIISGLKHSRVSTAYRDRQTLAT